MSTIDQQVSTDEELSVLVVDDSEIDRFIASALIRQRFPGAKVVTAADGQQALARIAAEKPHLIVTDMQMPVLDGLELVQTVRREQPQIPTILMTAHGSEELALAALQAGAASYVPKSKIETELVETVVRVAESAQAHRAELRLHECWTATEFEFCLDNDTSLIPPLVAHLQQYVARVRPCDETELVRLGVALHEALRNAIHHGNLELESGLRQDRPEEYYRMAELKRRMHPYADRRVWVTALESRSESRYEIRDQGPGFDVSSVRYDPNNRQHLEQIGGRGLFLIHTFMDEVRFNPHGNQITMIHRRSGAGSDRISRTASVHGGRDTAASERKEP